jgi:hypothetical protein
MAASLSSAFVTLFDAEVKQAYQGVAKLRGTTRMRTGVEGSTAKFPKLSAGVATVRTPQTDVVPLNATWSNVTATLADYNAAEYSDIFSQQKVNFDERRELVQLVSNAIGRRMDQVILDALAATATTSSVSNDIGGTDTNLNVAKLRTAKQYLDAANVPPEGRVLVIHANGLSSLLADTTATSADYNSVRALVAGEINTYLGFKIITLGDRTEGGLAKDGSNDRTCFAFHRDAVGYAEGIAPKVEVNYVPEKTSWLVNALFSAGAIEIEAAGVAKIICRES